MKSNKKKTKVPFYAQLLTKQEMMNAGGSTGTSPAKDQAQTQKWPSDGDDSTPVNDTID